MWSARHGATTTLPDLPKAELRPAAETDTVMIRRVPAERRPERALGARLDRAGMLRLMMLRVILGLGAVVLLGSGAAVAAIHVGAVAAVASVLLSLVLTGWLAVRGTPGTSLVGRLDRVLPRGRASRPKHTALPATRTR